MNIKKLALIFLLASSSLCSAGIWDWLWGEEIQLTEEQVRKNFLDAMRKFNSAARAGHRILFTPLEDVMKFNLFQIGDALDKSQEFKGTLEAFLTAVNKKPEAIETSDIVIDEQAKEITDRENKIINYSLSDGLKKCYQKHPDKKEKCKQLYKAIAQQLFSQAKFKKMFAEEKENSDS